MDYRLVKEIPEVDEYLALRRAVNYSVKSEAGAAVGLKNSCFCICVRDTNNNLLGMGRVIGDGGTVFQVVDIMVEPAYQKQGMGQKILTEIMIFLETVDQQSYINLIASKEGQKLYQNFGFSNVAPSIAMVLEKK